MTKVSINPGICGLITDVEVTTDDRMEVEVQIRSDCPSINKMTETIGSTMDAYEVCLGKPGSGPLYEYALAHMPGHASCPAIAGITKCIEVECKLALPSDASIKFV